MSASAANGGVEVGDDGGEAGGDFFPEPPVGDGVRSSSSDGEGASTLVMTNRGREAGAAAILCRLSSSSHRLPSAVERSENLRGQNKAAPDTPV